jgi:hypothetical protein
MSNAKSSAPARPSRKPRSWLLGSATLALAALLGALLPAAAQADPSQPVISDVTFVPAGVGADGGSVTVSALIESPEGIADAAVSVQFATGGTGGGAMHRSAPDSDTWEADVTVPPNNNDFAVTHAVQISATDTTGSSQTLDAGSIAQDAADTSDQAPTVEVTDVDPQFLLVGGGQVRIQATAHDDHAISQVYAVVDGPGDPTTVTMNMFEPTDYEGFITIPANTEPNPVGYTVVAHVLDDTGQEGTDTGPSIGVDPNVVETETPAFSNVVISPSTVAAEGGTVTISATITSSAGISEAGITVELNGGSGGQLGEEMHRTAPDSDTWTGDVSIPPNFSNDPINHNVDLSATGNDGGSALEIVGSIDQDGQIQFDQAPNVSITSVTPTELGSDGGNVTIQANADDDHSVSEVYVTLTGSDGSSTVVNLEGTSAQGWQGTFIAPANTSRSNPVTYTTQATALDDAGQSGFADGPQISVAPVPNQEPQVTNPSVAPVSLPAAGGEVTIRADVTDPDGTLADVHADITHPDGTVTTLAMTQASEGAPYEAIWTAPANTAEDPAEHVVSVTAVDTEGASGSAEAGSVTVDGVPPFDEHPFVFDSSLTPTSLPVAGGQVTIAASATDDRSVSEVYAVVTAPDGSTSQVPMDPVSESRFEGVLTVPANTRFVPSAYQVEVTALDDIGQPGSEATGSVTVAARVDQPPQVATAAVVPGVLSGSGTARIRATVIEDRAMGEVYALVQSTGGAPTRVEMVADPGSTAYEGLFSAPENRSAGPVAYAVEVVATDQAGHTGRASAGSLMVTPVPTPVTRLRLSDSTLRFGRVAIGGQAVRVVTIRNPGAPGSGAIVLDLSVLGGRFELVGSSAGRDHLRLRPGRTRQVTIAFSPGAVGRRTGQLLLDRTDGAQTGLAIDLVGRGIRR